MIHAMQDPPHEEKPNGPGEKKATQGSEAFGEEDT